MSLKLEHGFYPPSFDEHGFEGVFNIHGFDFLGLDFAINTSEFEELIHSILEKQFREFKREFKSLHL